MNIFIKSDFWSDPKIEELEADEKLALLWLMTNSRCDLCGFTEISKRRFEFETGASFEALQRACEGVGKGFENITEGCFWVRNLVAHQIGKGKKLKRNNIARSMVKKLSEKSEALQEMFLEEYPEARELLEELPEYEKKKSEKAKPFTSPPEGVGKGKGKEKEKGKVKSPSEKSDDSEDVTAPSSDDCETLAVKNYPKLDEQWVRSAARSFFLHFEGRRWIDKSGTELLPNLWKTKLRKWIEDNYRNEANPQKLETPQEKPDLGGRKSNVTDLRGKSNDLLPMDGEQQT